MNGRPRGATKVDRSRPQRTIADFLVPLVLAAGVAVVGFTPKLFNPVSEFLCASWIPLIRVPAGPDAKMGSIPIPESRASRLGLKVNLAINRFNHFIFRWAARNTHDPHRGEVSTPTPPTVHRCFPPNFEERMKQAESASTLSPQEHSKAILDTLAWGVREYEHACPGEYPRPSREAFRQ